MNFPSFVSFVGDHSRAFHRYPFGNPLLKKERQELLQKTPPFLPATVDEPGARARRVACVIKSRPTKLTKSCNFLANHRRKSRCAMKRIIGLGNWIAVNQLARHRTQLHPLRCFARGVLVGHCKRGEKEA